MRNISIGDISMRKTGKQTRGRRTGGAGLLLLALLLVFQMFLYTPGGVNGTEAGQNIDVPAWAAKVVTVEAAKKSKKASGDIETDPFYKVPDTITDHCGIYDNAEFFNKSEKQAIKKQFEEIYEQKGLSLFMMSTRALGKSDPYGKAVAELRSRIQAKEVVILFFAHKEAGNRRTQIYAYGDCEDRLNSDRLHETEEGIAEYAKGGDMVRALGVFISDIPRYMDRAPILDSLFMQWYVHLGVAAVLAALALMIAWPSGGKENVQFLAKNYLDQKNSKLIGRIDRYTHTETQVIHHEHDSGGGGGGGTTGGGADY